MIIITDSATNEKFIIEAFSRTQLLDMLKKDTVVVSFRKRTNGKQRLMYCTRNLQRIPKNHHPSGVGMPYDPVSKGLIPVYDLVKKEWRSFAVDNVADAKVKTLGWLTRFLQRRKYTMDEGVQFPQEGFIVEAYEIQIDTSGLLEMAAGPVGQGKSRVDRSGNHFTSQLNRILKTLVANESSLKIEKWGKVENYNVYAYRQYDSLITIIVSTENIKDVIDKPESIVFFMEISSDHDMEGFNNGFITYSVSLPMTSPSHLKRGIAKSVYKVAAQHVNISSSDTQTFEARLLWNSLSKDRDVSMYLYNIDMDSVEEEITGNQERFQEIMADGDPSEVFILTTRKPVNA